MLDTINNYLIQHPQYTAILKIIGVLALSVLHYFIIKKILLKLVKKLVEKSKVELDDILYRNKVFHRIALLVPVFIIYSFANVFLGFEGLVSRLSTALIVWIMTLIVTASLNSFGEFAQRGKLKGYAGLKSYVQIASIILYILGIVVIISVLVGRSPLILLSGIGAMTAVMLFVFKDTILSFLASLQISSFDLVRVGDWIEVPKYGADGDVIDIALYTVKIQNWDKTITIIPTHKLLEESFKNWRGMTESGGRRIKRAVNIDLSSIKLCDREMLDRFKRFQLISDYLVGKEEEINEYNLKAEIDTSELINGRGLTNIGIFRTYIKAYLRAHPKIHNDMTFLIRQMEPGSNGLPLQIYVFTNNIEWAVYEDIQSDIFDHILAVVSSFDLKVFQVPTGNDFQKILR
ncbi:MAG: mechanosensitive ion channel [Calditrichaeota bacterium]|nr:mechanosensitive ion channel [Calditrichota bacterium]